MGVFIPSGRPRPKRFSYAPRYYNPKKDEDIKRRMRIQGRSRRRRSPIGLLFMLVLLAFALYIYNALG